MNITLRVDCGEPSPVEVEMPAVTTGKYAFARVIETLGGDPREIRGLLVPICEGAPDLTAALGDDEIVAEWDGALVAAVVFGG